MPTKTVTCCEAGAQYLEELPNDQEPTKGYRHIRIDVYTGAGILNTRVKFCPFCGFEFKMPEAATRKLNTTEWYAEETRLKNEIKSLEGQLRELHFRCSHHDEAGADTRYGCGGGETMCPYCRTQCD